MKILDSQKEAWRNQAEAKAKQKEKEHLKWFENQNFLTKENRLYLVNELVELQEKETRMWSYIHRDRDRNISDWKSHEDKMHFEIDLINLKIEKIKQVLINNKFK